MNVVYSGNQQQSVPTTQSTKNDILAIGKHGNMVRQDLVVDSGSAISCLPKRESEDLPKTPLSDTRTFQDASGRAVVRHGACNPEFILEDGSLMSARMESMEVRRPLLSVCASVKAGNRYVFETAGGQDVSYMETPSGQRHRVYARNGIYVLPTWRF